MNKKIGIVGCGGIGQKVAKAIKEKFSDMAELVGVYDIDKKKADKLGGFMPLEDLIESSDLIVEAASPKAAREIVPIILDKGKEMLVMSTGGLLGIPLQEGIYIPSGAIAGLDGLSAATCGKISRITLTTTKPPKALAGAPYIKEKNINLDNIKSDTVIFSGSVEDAVKAFPANINVCATLAIVSKKPELISVKIIASTKVKRNTHEVDIEGDFGRISCKMENEPLPDNPKTSYLAALSAIDTLRKILYG